MGLIQAQCDVCHKIYKNDEYIHYDECYGYICTICELEEEVEDNNKKINEINHQITSLMQQRSQIEKEVISLKEQRKAR